MVVVMLCDLRWCVITLCDIQKNVTIVGSGSNCVINVVDYAFMGFLIDYTSGICIYLPNYVCTLLVMQIKF